MDVRCERCSTEYEFDDALVSGRGTTVKCTNCGHKFKIRPRSGDFSEDFWNVEVADGRTLVFTSLRELQRAIQTSVVGRGDLLSRGGLKQKPIGQIPELVPFFDQRDQRKSVPPVATAGSALPPGTRSSRTPPPPGITPPVLAAPRQRLSTRPDFPPAPPPLAESFNQTLIGPGGDLPSARLPEVRPDVAVSAPAPALLDSIPPPTERDAEPPAHAAADNRSSLMRTQPMTPPRAELHHSPPPLEISSPLPAPALRTMRFDDEEDNRRRSLPDGPASMGRRRSVGGYLVAIVVLAGAGLIGAVWARDHLGGLLGKGPAPVATTDPRAIGLLAAGEKALAEGNLESSKESFDKASALAEKDPRVLLDVARLAAVRADVPWLKSRLLTADAADETRFTKDSLLELSAAARKAADDALAASPDDPAALRAKIDALRIAGDRDGARALVGKLSTSAAHPETAYVLAGLDLADPEPLWSTVLEHLRTAANAETGPGRARAALAYALARSGDVTAAKIEVERLAAMARQHPLLPLLRAYAEHANPAMKVDALPDAGAPDAAGPRVGRVDSRGRPLPIDSRQLLLQAEAARRAGDNDRAQTLFAAALDRNPNDAEALNGLAKIAHSRRDLNGARASYKRVLSINPSYVPALVGLADVEYESGNRAAAMKTYKEIVERFPEGTYPGRVRQRVEGTSPAAPPTTSASSGSVPAPSDTGGGG